MKQARMPLVDRVLRYLFCFRLWRITWRALIIGVCGVLFASHMQLAVARVAEPIARHGGELDPNVSDAILLAPLLIFGLGYLLWNIERLVPAIRLCDGCYAAFARTGRVPAYCDEAGEQNG